MKYATANSRKAVKWKNGDTTMEALKARFQNTVRTTETIEEYRKMSKAQQADIKDIGGFVGGHLRNGRRKKGYVLCRSMLTLDMDYGEPDVWDTTISKIPYQCLCHSTHKHTPENPRLRLVIPLTREISEPEYEPVARMFAKEVGIDMFDDSTYEANRLMYWPSTSVNGEYVFKEKDGIALNPDDYLAKYDAWQDSSTWPVSSRESCVEDHGASKQADPLAKPGVIGAFCRAYPISAVIPELLSDIYAPTDDDCRYDYIPADSPAGAVSYGDKFLYSHHSSDPACKKLCNAFDLVRIHRFRDLDKDVLDESTPSKMPSYKAMMDFASGCDKVKILLLNEKQAQAGEDFASPDEDGGDDWKAKLQYQSRSTVLQNSVWNEMLILNNDPDFAGFAFNEMANRIQVTGEVPWDRPADNKFWRDADTAQLKALIDVRYVAFSDRNHNVSFTKVADDRRFHPVRNYLNSLPEWDQTPRLDELFIKCLQADDSKYVRAVTRKTLVAAVTRIYHPGTKFDTVPVLDGAQGIGKSTMWKSLAGDEYFSDALSLTDMDDKSGAEKLQGFWIIEIGELAGMKKADIEKVKSFLSTSDDKYRPSYGKVVESHPRQCVVVATVNGEHGYLRDITGNRRFWIVKCRQTENAVRWKITPEERDQIWAEAKYYYEQGEKLYLEGDLLTEAEEAQRSAMETDERQGLVEQYLSKLLPENWSEMDLYQRRNFLDGDDITSTSGTVERTEVSNAEIWCECFGRNIADLKPSDSYAIAALMTQVNGWKRTNCRGSQPLYGRQRLYEKTK
jgi:putative DNA primase/helicase